MREAGLTPRFLVNNAGFGLMGRAIELDAAEQLAIVDLNMRALTALTLRFLPAIVAAKGGVLNVASVAAFMPGPGFAVYYATKAYVRSFSEALSQELKPLGVKVACLCPGPVQTGFQARAGHGSLGLMAAMKPAMLPAAEVARQGYEGPDGRQARHRAGPRQSAVRLGLGGDAAGAAAAAARVRSAAALINAGEICPARAKARLCWPPLFT